MLKYIKLKIKHPINFKFKSVRYMYLPSYQPTIRLEQLLNKSLWTCAPAGSFTRPFHYHVFCRLGKTIQVIGFLSGLFDNQHVHSVLIVVPVSVIPNWEREFERW